VQEQLPPITTTGENTFGCKVNGKVWVAKSNTSFPHMFFALDRVNNSQLILSGNLIRRPTDDFTVNLTFSHDIGVVEYTLGYNNDAAPSARYIDANKNKFWETDSLRGGGVTLLRFDSVKQIISGTFYFDCINPETGEILKITEGRFDMNFTY
jgi:hypothetical protein